MVEETCCHYDFSEEPSLKTFEEKSFGILLLLLLLLLIIIIIIRRRRRRRRRRRNNNTTCGNKPEGAGERKEIKMISIKSKTIQTKQDISK